MGNKKNEVKMGFKNEPDALKSVKSKGTTEYYQGTPNKSIEVEELVKPGTLINRNNHPVILSYNGEAIKLSPRERVKIANIDKLGGLCPNVVLVPENK